MMSFCSEITAGAAPPPTAEPGAAPAKDGTSAATPAASGRAGGTAKRKAQDPSGDAAGKAGKRPTYTGRRGSSAAATVKAEPVVKREAPDEGVPPPAAAAPPMSAATGAAAVQVKQEPEDQDDAAIAATVAAPVVAVKAEPVSPRRGDDTGSQLREWLQGGACPGVKAQEPAAEGAAAAGPRKFRAEPDGGVWFYLIDAFEDDRASPPRVYLFGKARREGLTQASDAFDVAVSVYRNTDVSGLVAFTVALMVACGAMSTGDFIATAEPANCAQRGTIAQAAAYIGTGGATAEDMIKELKYLTMFIICTTAYSLGKPSTAWENERHVNFVRRSVGGQLPQFTRQVREQLTAIAKNINPCAFVVQMSRILDFQPQNLPAGGFSFNPLVRGGVPAPPPGGAWAPVLGRRCKKEPYTFCTCGHWTYDRLLRKRGHCIGCMAALAPASDAAMGGGAQPGGGGGGNAGGGGSLPKSAGLASSQLAFMQKFAADLPPDKARALLDEFGIQKPSPHVHRQGHANEVQAAEGRQRATANRPQQALHNQVRVQKMLAEAGKKVDDAMQGDLKAKKEVEEAARRLAQRAFPPEEPSAKKSVVHIGALLADPSSLSLDLGEELGLSGDFYSDEGRKQLEDFSKECVERASALLSTAVTHARDEAQKIKKERSEKFEQLKKVGDPALRAAREAGEARVARAAARQELDEAARHVVVTFAPVYVVSGAGLNGRNMRVLSQHGARISQVAGPVVLIGDWQNSVDDIANVKFLSRWGSSEIPSDLKVTYTGGRGAASKIDFGLVSSGFLQAARFDGVDSTAPWGTHLAVKFELKAEPGLIEGLRVMEPRALDVASDLSRAWQLDWDSAAQRAMTLIDSKPARFWSNLPLAKLASEKRDAIQVSMGLGGSIGFGASASLLLSLYSGAARRWSIQACCLEVAFLLGAARQSPRLNAWAQEAGGEVHGLDPPTLRQLRGQARLGSKCLQRGFTWELIDQGAAPPTRLLGALESTIEARAWVQASKHMDGELGQVPTSAAGLAHSFLKEVR
ncbi:unnamed protein product [Prorocentrum cordatum]|uniref:Uncharacterized protein n=1 Tax=Prorocentrum cordatum TaxID=2364126 RepID=A0ABN9WVX0_9DINO|nr:unnamed protein product [Polarella glacialis]